MEKNNHSSSNLGGNGVACTCGKAVVYCDNLCYMDLGTTKAETTKREVIRKAYGEHYDEVKNFLDEYGYCDARSKDGSTLGYNAHNVEWKNWNASYKWRPISLSGLETNNGWFSIKEHGLPKEDGEYKVYYNEEFVPSMQINIELKNGVGTFQNGNFILIDYSDINDNHYRRNITHWKPIEQFKPPLY